MTERPSVFSPTLWRAIGAKVKEAREAGPIPNPSAFALTIQVKRQFLHNIENGQKAARLETLYRIARATNRPIAYFLPDADL